MLAKDTTVFTREQTTTWTEARGNASVCNSGVAWSNVIFCSRRYPELAYKLIFQQERTGIRMQCVVGAIGKQERRSTSNPNVANVSTMILHVELQSLIQIVPMLLDRLSSTRNARVD